MIKVGDKVRPCKGYMVNLMVVEVEDPLPGVVDGSIYSFHYYKVAPWVERRRHFRPRLVLVVESR
jgi:hypothetical protein